MSLRRTIVLIIFAAVIITALTGYSIQHLSGSLAPMGCSGLAGSEYFNPAETVAFWQNRMVSPLLASADTLSEKDRNVLGLAATEKWIEIDLAKQMLYAHQGDQVVLQSPISSGLYRRTPAGEYAIWYKVKYTKMEGGSKLDNSYYYLPNVPFSMFFHGDYGIHGAYWHNNFGHPMSHGCVNEPVGFSEKLFYWADPQLPSGKGYVRASADNPGTKVVIHD